MNIDSKKLGRVLTIVLVLGILMAIGLSSTVQAGNPQAGPTPAPKVVKPKAFANGDFENGDFTGWTKSTYDNGGLTGYPGPYTGANITRNAGGTDLSIIVGSPTTTPLSQPDSILGAAASLRWPFQGHYSARVNGVPGGGGHNGNRIIMQVTTTAQDVRPADGKIHVFLAYAPVLDDPGHASNEQPYFYVALTNVTKSTLLFEAFAFSHQGGLPWKVITAMGGDTFVYLDWQAIEIAPSATALAAGDVISLSAEAAGCTPSSHPGWVYLDSFGTLAPTLTTVSASPNPSTCGQSVTLTAHIADLAGNPVNTGTVQFYADGVAIGTPQPVSGGQASLTGVSSLSVGNHTIVAVYTGAGGYNDSTSANYTHVVNGPCTAPVPVQLPKDVPEADTLLLLGGGIGGLATWLGWQWRRVKRTVK